MKIVSEMTYNVSSGTFNRTKTMANLLQSGENFQDRRLTLSSNKMATGCFRLSVLSLWLVSSSAVSHGASVLDLLPKQIIQNH